MNKITPFPSGPKLRKPEASEPFSPSTRGDLSAASTSQQALHAVAPESPRPVELLESVHVAGPDNLTAQDLALHEWLLAKAYDEDSELKRERYSIPTFEARDYLGNIRREQLEASLARLQDTKVSFDLTIRENRLWGKVPMMIGWMSSLQDNPEADIIHFTVPEPIRYLMRVQQRYRHIELAAIAQMKSKYGIRLYKKLLVRALSGKENLLQFEATPEQIASWLDYRPSKLHVGQLRLRVLTPALLDLQYASRFKVEVSEKKGRRRGEPTIAYRFTLQPTVQSFHHVKGMQVSKEHMALYNYADNDEFYVSPKVWLRAVGRAQEWQDHLWLRTREGLAGRSR